MSRKTTGLTATTRRRVAVGTAILSATALLGSGMASAVGGADIDVTSFKVFGTADGVAPVGPLRGLNTVLEVKGTNLDELDKVLFGDVRADKVLVESPTLAYVTPPASATAKDVKVSFFDKGSSTADDEADYAYTAGPVLTKVTAAAKDVTVEGSQFTGATAVLFGDVLVKVDKKTSPTDTKIVVKAPSTKSGAVDVSVITPNGIGTLAGAYGVAPVIRKIQLASDTTKSPKAVTKASAATGTVATGTSATATVNNYLSDTGTVVLLTGTGFSGLKTLTFGSAVAQTVVVNDTVLRARIPAKAAADLFDGKLFNVAKVEVVAENAFGKSKGVKFEFHKAPVVHSADDVVGKADAATNSVTLKGTGLQGAKVSFGTKTGKVSASADGSVTVLAPKQAAGDYDIKVVTTAGLYTVPQKYSYKATDATTAWPAG